MTAAFQKLQADVAALITASQALATENASLKAQLASTTDDAEVQALDATITAVLTPAPAPAPTT